MHDKRKHLVETALQLFYQHGVNSVGINEVLKHSGVAKKTLYNYFDSKDALILATLAVRHQRFLDWLTLQLANSVSNSDLASKLFHGLDQWFNSQVPALGDFRGCFFINTAAEFAEPTSAIHQACMAHKQAVAELIAEQLPSPNAQLVDLLCLLKEGAIVSAYVNHDPQAALRSLAALQPIITNASPVHPQP